MIKIAWLEDDTYLGGAELSSDILCKYAPDDVNIVHIPAWQRRIDIEQIDMFIVANCTQYSADFVQYLQQKPTIKVLWDVYPHGDAKLRRWLLDNAFLIGVTPRQSQMLGLTNHLMLMPSPVEYDKLKDYRVAQRLYDDSHMCYFGALFSHKLGTAIEYARQKDATLHVYGRGDWQMLKIHKHVIYHGAVDYAQVPVEMSKYSTLVHMPYVFDPCPRVILEAWYLGLQVITNEMQGATWWIENEPQALFDAPLRFWDYVMIVIGKETDAN